MIKMMRLLSGEDIICSIHAETSDSYKITNVVQIVSSISDEEHLKVTFLPFAPAADLTNDYLEISKSYVPFVTNPVKTVILNYKDFFKTGGLPETNNTPTLKNTESKPKKEVLTDEDKPIAGPVFVSPRKKVATVG